VLKVSRLEDIGFVPPWAEGRVQSLPPQEPGRAAGLGPVPSTAGSTQQPPSVAADFAAVTVAHRHLYWSVPPAQLLPSCRQHAQLGQVLLPLVEGAPRILLAQALAESLLLLGRIAFFDQRQPELAGEAWVRALQAAGEADDALLGAAILAHSAFIPGWSDDRQGAVERIRSARTYARRAPASADFLAWLDAVAAECEARCGHPREALRLIHHAEDILAVSARATSPEWMDWFTPVRLAAFKGNVQLTAGHLPQARTTLQEVLDQLDAEEKQRSVVLGDLAAVEVAAGNVEKACEHALAALELLSKHWYAAGMERVRDVRRSLEKWTGLPCVQELDDNLYTWITTVSALER
jgi:tetratricopeptide (TPR) repeat protein